MPTLYECNSLVDITGSLVVRGIPAGLVHRIVLLIKGVAQFTTKIPVCLPHAEALLRIIFSNMTKSYEEKEYIQG